ncbi:MAG: FKBP-type peptidyl-prolyl cis-trans isomerase [Desulfobacteraceae bacterium]|nr:MAG: FKBP-type peptidyl-prolyl cis-trans isomerase [Desulfobacteraceae bacterium]
MRFITKSLLCAALLLLPGCQAEKTTLKISADPAYSTGYQIGANFRNSGTKLDPDALAAGVRDGLGGAAPQLSEAEMRTHLNRLKMQMGEIQRKRIEEQKELVTRNLIEGEAYLAENARKEGIQALPSGLQYQVLTAGQGNAPKATDSVTVHYRGTLIDGTEFDSTFDRGEPATFRLNKVIKGWSEALQLMQPGAKWKLFLPADMAYGKRGVGQRIPPNSALIFEVELISVGGS